ncbi:Ribonuclease 3 [Dissostichus eleginoides]|uniref:Ribonuclease 3 n=1 Tax=Dissostichus eleginoides TaxID=100907 RepID=A0AAD9C6E2_DISEL|nr:Ribonuclease 3 [Dissostichus eleginoides]
MHDYLKHAGELWEDSTRALHDNSPETMVLWRDKVIKGLQKPVQTALEDVINLETQPFHDWKQTVTHWYTRHQRKMDQEDDEVKILTKRLLKAQVAEKDNETNKKKAKAMPQMSAMSNLHVDIQDIVAQLLLLGKATKATYDGIIWKRLWPTSPCQSKASVSLDPCGAVGS